MPTVDITIPALPEQVRTVRLVAAAAARRCGIPEGELDEVRLAVGEVVARAVVRHRRSRLAAPVRVTLVDDDGALAVVVRDGAPLDLPDLDDGAALALASALAGRCEQEDAATVRLTWPT